MSTPPRRPRWPLSLILTSYQVGRPWMFEGKMLRELAGIPIRRIDLANSELALADPDPLTLANLTTKSLTLFIWEGIRSELVRCVVSPAKAGVQEPGARCRPPCIPAFAGDDKRELAAAACG